MVSRCQPHVTRKIMLLNGLSDGGVSLPRSIYSELWCFAQMSVCESETWKASWEQSKQSTNFLFCFRILGRKMKKRKMKLSQARERKLNTILHTHKSRSVFSNHYFGTLVCGSLSGESPTHNFWSTSERSSPWECQQQIVICGSRVPRTDGQPYQGGTRNRVTIVVVVIGGGAGLWDGQESHKFEYYFK